MSDSTRTRSDWIEGGLAELAKPRTMRLSVAPVAAALGATKGSFYWHFKDLPAFRAAIADAYAERCDTCLSVTDGINDPLGALLEGLAPDPAAESALRVLARGDDHVAQVLERIDRRRIDAIGAILMDQNREAARAPRLIYAAWLGVAHLAGPLGIPEEKLRRAATARLVA